VAASTCGTAPTSAPGLRAHAGLHAGTADGNANQLAHLPSCSTAQLIEPANRLGHVPAYSRDILTVRERSNNSLHERDSPPRLDDTFMGLTVRVA
jgi:hypothetical protein